MSSSSISNISSTTSFGQLIRRSKLATWDPIIEQVYTTQKTGGFRARLDFGLKRALPKKVAARNPYILLQSIDTNFKYTEFKQSNKLANWIERIDEFAIPGKRKLDPDNKISGSHTAEYQATSLGWYDPPSVKVIDKDSLMVRRE
jgi:hypothetical protein